MPLYPCKHKPCPELLPASGYCDKHQQDQKDYQSKIYRKVNENRVGSEYYGFIRSSEWQTVRNDYIKTHAFCENCTYRVSTSVHHIKPLRTAAGWLMRLDRANLMAVCEPCHNALDNLARMRDSRNNN